MTASDGGRLSGDAGRGALVVHSLDDAEGGVEQHLDAGAVGLGDVNLVRRTAALGGILAEARSTVPPGTANLAAAVASAGSSVEARLTVAPGLAAIAALEARFSGSPVSGVSLCARAPAPVAPVVPLAARLTAWVLCLEVDLVAAGF